MATSSGPNSSKPTTGAVVGGVYNAAGELLVDGQGSPLQLDASGNLKVAAIITPSGLQNVNIADVSGNPPALTNPLPVELSDGTNALGVAGNPIISKDAADGSTGAAVPASATFQGLRAATAYPTAVTDGQMVGSMGDKAGRMVSVLNAPRDLVFTAVLNSASSSLVSFIASGGASTFTDIVTFIATNETSTATIVSLSDGTTTYKYALAANGGIVINFPTPKPAASSATAWQVSNSAAVAVDYEALYIKNK